MDTIPVIVEEESGENTRTLGGGGKKQLKDIDVKKLQESVGKLSAQVAQMLGDVKEVGGFKLKQVQLSASISASGGIQLIGTVQAGMSGGITLTFTR